MKKQTAPNSQSRRWQRRSRALMEAVEPRLLFATDILSYHGGDITDNGVNANETQLTPGNISVASFGKQFVTDVRDTPNLTGIPTSVLPSGINFAAPNGQIYAEPLVKTGVNITAGPYQGVHDVVFVATEMDSLFAIDANGGNILWKDSFLYNAAGNPNPLNATVPVGVTAVPGGFGTETNSQDVSPWIGILSTPVIDPNSGYIYLTAKTREVHNGDQADPHYVYTLHKVRMSDGLDTSVVIGDTTLGNTNPSNPTYTYNSGPYVLGTGAGAINVGGQNRVYFNAVREMNRPGLIINNGRLYIEFASHGDNEPYHGWILTYDPTTLTLNGAFNTTPNSGEGEGGIWQGGGFGSFDSSGNLYVETGNGGFDGSNGTNHTGAITGLDANGFPINGDYGDSFLKIAIDNTTTQGNQGTNKNGWGLKVLDYFSPYNNKDLDSADRDLGSGGPIILSGVMSSTNNPLLVGAGKEGKIYLIDTGNMGKFSNTDHVVQTIGGAINGSLDTPAFFNGRLYYTSGYGGPGISWQVSNGTINTASAQTTPDQFVFPGSSPMITANGTLNGIAWMIDKGGQLRAYDASNLTNELWNSSQNSARDSLGSAVKFSVATPVNGRVYAGTSGFLISYGPPVPPTSAPADPTNLVATSTGAATIQLTWTDNSNNEDGFKIERSSDGKTFTEIGTVGVNQTFFLDSNLSSQSLYYYQVRAFNSFNTLSYSNYTNVANATTTASGSQSPVDLYTFDEGNGTGAGDGIGGNNGSLSSPDSPLWVTGRVGSGAISFDGTGKYNQTGQASVDLLNNLAPVLGGTSSLAFWIKTTQVGNNTGWSAPAVTGVEQNNGANDIGWGSIDATGHIGISVGDSGFLRSATAINDGQWHHVAISRDSASGAIKIYVDGVLSKTGTLQAGAKTSVFKSIGRLTDVANDGITVTGGNYFNGQLDDVRIYNQIINPNEVSALALSPATPTNLVVTPASGTQLNLSWTDVATTETGYKVERSINGGPWAQIQLLPANTNSYNDGGLLQNTPYSYRVRATNSAGDSGYSNTVNTSTPIAPVTPTNATVTFVSASQINLSWQDNSDNETGFKVLRRIGANQFAQIADLPANTTSYNDTNNISPGTSYDYHIQGYNIAGYSDFTGLTVTSLAATPKGVAIAVVPGSITVSWGAAAGAISYNVYRGTTPGGEDPTPIATGVTDTSLVDNNVTDGQFYYYQITALNSDDVESARSAEATNSPIQPPTANPDSATGYQNQPISINVLGNDTDSSGTIDPTTVAITNQPAHGTLTINPTSGLVTYTPGTNFTGPDQFSYTVNDTQGNVSAPALVSLTVSPLQTVYLSSLTSTASSNGWGPYERDRSNGEMGAADGHTITLNGQTYAKGLGVHAPSDITFNIAGGNYTEFDSDIGVDDEVGNSGSVVFQVYVDGVLKYTSPLLTGTSAITSVAVPLVNASTLRLVVTDGGNGNTYDHADWAGARLLQNASPPPPPPPSSGSTYVSDLPLTVTSNGWGPPEKDRSNGEIGAADGHTITLNGQTYTKGIGVHANSDISIALNGQYTTFTSDIGVDDEVGNNGSVIFQVYTDGVLQFTSSMMTGASATQQVSVNVTGKTTLRLVVTDGGNGNTYDHADWAGAQLSAGQALPAPSSIPSLTSATYNSSSGKVDLAWTYGASDATSFRIERKLDAGGTYTPVQTVSSSTFSFSDPGPLAGNTTYDYRVFAVNGGGDSTASNVMQVTTPAVTQTWLSDLTWTTATNGWGPVEKDMSNGETAAGDGHTLSIRSNTYAKGLGVHAPSDISYSIGGLYKTFTTDVGVDNETNGGGSVDFQIYVDGVLAMDSGVLTGTSAVKTMTVSVAGAQTLRLVVTDGGNGNTYDHADWAGAQLLA